MPEIIFEVELFQMAFFTDLFTLYRH